MAASDSLFLLCVLAFAPGIVDRLSLPMATVFCQVTQYLSYVSSGFSYWCWVVLSVQRYTAIFQPYKYRKCAACHKPVIPLLLVLVICFLINIGVPITASYSNDHVGRCDLNVSETVYILFFLVDAIWGYFLPFILVLALEAKVLLCRPLEFQNRRTSDLRKTESYSHRTRVRQRQYSQLQSIFLLALLDLFLTLPCYIFRVLATFHPRILWLNPYPMIFETISYILYYSLFGVNGL